MKKINTYCIAKPENPNECVCVIGSSEDHLSIMPINASRKPFVYYVQIWDDCCHMWINAYDVPFAYLVPDDALAHLERVRKRCHRRSFRLLIVPEVK